MSNERPTDDARPEPPDTPAPVLRCDDVQPLLFDYLARELGDARSALVREHLRRCEGCRDSASDMQRTLDVLHNASEIEKRLRLRLSEKRRAQVLFTYNHPVMGWIVRHHVAVSAILAIIVVGAVLFSLGYVQIVRNNEVEGIRVRITLSPDGSRP
jgi:predicted anti-sigma-YlaC factor YlaD